MNRRQFIGSAAAVSLTAAASFARAHDHAGHAHHAGHGEHAHPHHAPRARVKPPHIALKPAKSAWRTASPC